MTTAQPIIRWMDRYQVALYLGGLGVGVIVGLTLPGVAPFAEVTIYPVLALLLYATFLGIPVRKIGRAFKDARFMTAVLILNFVIVPVVVFGVSRIVAHDQVLLVGVLFVLLTPCIDYVIVFAQLAGGDAQRLLAAAPTLMIVQMILLPGYLWMFVGSELVGSIELMPFIDAFVWIIVVPFLLAGATQFAAPYWQPARLVDRAATGLMIPFMVVTLGVVVASQIAEVTGQLGTVVLAVPVYLLFAAVMVLTGKLIGRLANLELAQRRSLIFSGVTRNSLVVLPLVLALPAAYDVAPLVVVTQTLVELVLMVVFVRFIPAVERQPERPD